MGSIWKKTFYFSSFQLFYWFLLYDNILFNILYLKFFRYILRTKFAFLNLFTKILVSYWHQMTNKISFTIKCSYLSSLIEYRICEKSKLINFFLKRNTYQNISKRGREREREILKIYLLLDLWSWILSGDNCFKC